MTKTVGDAKTVGAAAGKDARVRLGFVEKRLSALAADRVQLHEQRERIGGALAAALKALAEGDADGGAKLDKIRADAVRLDVKLSDLDAAAATLTPERDALTSEIAAEESAALVAFQTAAAAPLRAEAEAALQDVARALGATIWDGIRKYDAARVRIAGEFPFAPQLEAMTFLRLAEETVRVWTGPKTWDESADAAMSFLFHAWISRSLAAAPGGGFAVLSSLGIR